VFFVSCLADEQSTTLYVLPENETELCPVLNTSRCLTLNNYVKDSVSYFLSDTIFMFLAGTHSLRGVFNVQNISNVSLVKYSTTELENPEIVCNPGTHSSGFFFSNVSRINMESLSFFGCGHLVHGTSAAISVDSVTDISVSSLQVSHSVGYGLFAWNSYGLTTISFSNFTYNSRGGNLALYYFNCSSEATKTRSLVSIISSFFGHGVAQNHTVLSPGITAFICCTNISLEINRVTAFNNTVYDSRAVGGNMAIILRNRTNLISNTVTITNCHVEAGISHYGGGIFLSFEVVPATPVNNSLAQIVKIERTNFSRNHATGEGGGLYIITHEVVTLLHPVGLITVADCVFDSNTLDNRLSAGVALHVNSHNIPGYAEHVQPQYRLKLNRSTFTNSSLLGSDSGTASGAVSVFHSQSGVHVQDCVFNWNNVTGLSVGKSNIIFSGEITFEGNKGTNGGGLLMCDRSFLYLTPYTNVSFVGNHATGTGGGIYVSGLCLESIPECFYQFSRSILSIEDMPLLKTVSVSFANNTAGLAGSAIYGGSVDYCLVMNPWAYTTKIILGFKLFYKVFDVTHEETDYSYITSDPYEVCFCTDFPFVEVHRSVKTVQRTLYPGSTFTVMAVVVGQRNGTAPGAVKAIAGTNTSLGSLQTTQDVTVNCTPLNYTVYTSLSRTKIELRVQHSRLSPAPTLKIDRTFVQVNLMGCPIGFVLSSGMCTCSEALAGKPGIDCILEPYPTIRRSSYSWVGYHNSSDASKSGIIYQKYCPSGYCYVGPVDINSSEVSFEQNAQCAHFRVGLLCGSCPPNMSAIFGSPKCEVCSNKFLSLIIALAVAGVLLVAFLNLSNLTVTSGEINGLTFYANVMQITLKNISKTDYNRDVIFSFISWLNLDLGVRTCFYNGMDAFSKVFLQFVFPTYLFALAFLIMFLCRKYQRLANCMGTNAVKVLATLFFISYAKLLRIIILVFNVSIVTYPDNSSEWRWTEDGSILFARGKHLALVVCGFGAVCFSLPFTAILTFHPCMQRSSKKCFKWIHRLKPLLDAYSGVYKDRYRFWTGLLLFARLCLFLTFAVDVHQISYYKSYSVLFVCLFVLSLGWVFGGVYKDWRLDVLEASYIINLGLFSGASLNGNVSQERIAKISIGVAFATFFFTLIWKFRMLRVFKRVAAFVSQREHATVGAVPSCNISWFSISDHHGEGNDCLLDRESQPLLP
jgi:predicted outer membrane repeat protein